MVLFEDESSIRDYQAIHYAWYHKGKQKIIPTHGKHESAKLFGTVDYESCEVYVQEYQQNNAEAFLDFLDKILKKYPGRKIVMVLDNARIHYANLLQPFLKRHDYQLELLFLPPYSPNLNPVEKIWGWLKKSCVCNVFYDNFNLLRENIQQFITEINKNPIAVANRSLCIV